MVEHSENCVQWVPVGVYLGIVLPAMIGFGLTGSPLLVVFAMPSVVALVLAVISRRRRTIFGDMGIRRAPVASLAASALAPVAVTAAGVGVVIACGLGRLPTQWLLPIGAWHVLGGLRQGLFEEFGWRGFLQPRLTTLLGAHAAVLWTGLAWAVFHFGLIIGGGTPGGVPLWMYLPVFTLTLVAVSVFAGYLRLVTGSVWPAVVLHAAANIAGGYADQVVVSLSHPAVAQMLGDAAGLLVWLTLAVWAWPRLSFPLREDRRIYA
ncbi:CPBP family intramembrane glutamic endopeptidase [Nocardia acidivorans]|uniref:CPBP family intramembrane glutamic endopeptidase n=1 Tax=Nocardia acidivorans TaxID=404580 RepID=UPI00082C59BF|nr:CPBP family intramembrane glutamic endopeptidase [Nocardia acidivorans]